MQVHILWIAVASAAAFLLGLIFSKIGQRKYWIGDLRIDRSEPGEPPYFFLEVTDASKIRDGKSVMMHVKEENYIPQK